MVGTRTPRPIQPRDIEAGMILKGTAGQVRQILSVHGGRCLYRKLSNGSARAHSHPLVGGTGPTSLGCISNWAEEDVTSTWGKA